MSSVKARRRPLGERVRDWLTVRVARFLMRPIGSYQSHCGNDLALLKRHARKGDVLLVEGDQRVSALIKYLTHSSWSHAALYVGDELVRRGGALGELARDHFGEEAEYLVVEALPDGVVVSPIAKYESFNLRLCRPHRLRTAHLRIVLDEAVAAIGWRYDLRNVVELALNLLAVAVLPHRYRRDALRFGSGAARHVICTSLIGGLFHRVGFPVLPSVMALEDDASTPDPSPEPRRLWFPRSSLRYQGLYRRRHPTLSDEPSQG